jgi:DNA-binding MarR family transcriptional regulator
MSKVKTIENTYHDVLYWATSPKSKGTKYHLTQREDAVLRKLIHYHSNKKYITYSNEVISEHTYISVEHLKKIIPKLIKKGYINSSDYTSSNDGVFYTKRTITINWNVIEEALNVLPKKKAILEEETEMQQSETTSFNEIASEPIQPEVFQESIKLEEVTDNVGAEINSNIFLEKDKDFNFDEYMTPPKRKALEKIIKSSDFKSRGYNNIDDFKIFNREGLDVIFNFSGGVWNLLDLDNHKEELLENEHGITYSSHGYGASPTLSSYKDGEKIGSFLISPKALNQYFESKNKDFKDLTNRDFQTLSSFKIDFKLS